MSALFSQSSLTQAISKPRETKINWDTFESLKLLKSEIQKYADALKTLTPEQAIQERQSLDQYLQDNDWANLFFAQLATAAENPYATTQYELRVQLVKELIKLIQILPPEFRPRIARPQFDQRRLRINREAVDFVQAYTKRHDDLFNQQSGYPDYAAFEKELREKSDPAVKKALELIDQNQIEIVVRRPENARFWVPKVGFQNQFVTGSSRGSFTPSRRNTAEANMLKIPGNEYTPLDTEFKPKYGTMKAAESSAVRTTLESTVDYGSDIYTLKMEEIENRLTFFMDDSLYAGFSENPKSPQWAYSFIPWSRRLIMVPLLAKSLSLFGSNKFDLSATGVLPETSLPLVSRFAYWETQIFGQITLDMVKTFQFNKEPPTGEFLQELLKRKIEIIDGRLIRPPSPPIR